MSHKEPNLTPVNKEKPNPHPAPPRMITKVNNKTNTRKLFYFVVCFSSESKWQEFGGTFIEDNDIFDKDWIKNVIINLKENIKCDFAYTNVLIKSLNLIAEKDLNEY